MQRAVHLVKLIGKMGLDPARVSREPDSAPHDPVSISGVARKGQAAGGRNNISPYGPSAIMPENIALWPPIQCAGYRSHHGV
jgi:hypothetical protein